MKKFTVFSILLILINFSMFSCSSTPAEENNDKCSKTNLTGKCDDSKICKDGECIIESEICSVENKDGVCENELEECVEGECKLKKVETCENIDCGEHGDCGVFADGAKCVCNDGFVDYNFKCVALCSATNPDGICTDSSKECIEGECKDKLVETCENIDCGDHGECGVFGNGAKCVCDEGYIADGYTCVSSIATCKEDTCTEQYKTVCSVVDNAIKCSCDIGYIQDDTDRCVKSTLECNENEHVENEICVSNSKTVACIDNTPANAVKIDGDVEIIYTEGEGWSSPADCAFSCNNDFHVENGVCVENTIICNANEHEEVGECVANTKTVACNDANLPNNATKVETLVEITYTSESGWSTPTDCGFTCDTNYHLEASLCVSNTKMIACNDTNLPEHSIKVDGNVEVSYIEGSGWTSPADCDFTCSTTYHIEENICASNTKMTACDDTNLPEHSVKVDGNVEITYIEGSGWSNPTDCDFTCNDTYHQEDSICTSNSKFVACDDTNVPTNSIKIDALVEVNYIEGNGWSNASACGFTCNDTYHQEDMICVLNTKLVSCNDTNVPANAIKVDGLVEITYVDGSGWPIAADCGFTCKTEYAGNNCSTCSTGYQDNNNNGICKETCTISGLNCLGNSYCEDNSGTAICDCYLGYSGASCSDCAQGYRLSFGQCILDCSGFSNTKLNDEKTACICRDGYLPSGNTGNCYDPCQTNTCASQQECTFDNEGTTSCICNAEKGLEDDGNGNCQCVDSNSTFSNTFKSCRCNFGFHLNLDNICVVDEVCEVDTCTEENKTICKVGLAGIAECSCDSGFFENTLGTCVEECIVDEITQTNLNNSSDEAYEITLDSENKFESLALTNSVDNCGTDDDWYKLELEAGNKISVDILFKHYSGKDLDLYLYLEDSLNQYKVRGYSTTDNEHVEYVISDLDIPENKTTVTVFIRVNGYTSSKNIYDLKVEVEDWSSLVCDPSCDLNKEVCDLSTGEATCLCREDLGYFDNGYSCSNPCDLVTCDADRTCVSKSAVESNCDCSDGLAERNGVCEEISDIEASDACEAANIITQGFYQGTTLNKTDDIGVCEGLFISGVGGDNFYKLVLSEEVSFKASVSPIGNNITKVLRLIKEEEGNICNFDFENQLECKNSGKIGGLDYILSAGTYYIVVDSSDNIEGDYLLDVEYGNACAQNTCDSDKEFCEPTGFNDDNFDCSCDNSKGYFDDGNGNCINPCDTNICSFNNTECISNNFDSHSCVCIDGYHNISENSIDCVELGVQGADTCNGTLPVISEREVFGGSRANSSNSSVGTCGGNGYESIYVLEVTEAQIVEVKELSPDFDAVMYVKEDNCSTGNELICYDGVSNDRFERFFEIGTYYLYIDSNSANEADNYILEVNFKGDPCNSSCGNNEICKENPDNGSYACACNDYEGYFDDGNGVCVNPCEINTCPDTNSNGTGICSPINATEFSCACEASYSYDSNNNTCVNPCIPNTCPDDSENGTGTCTILSFTEFSCGCQNGFQELIIDGNHNCVEETPLQGVDTCENVPELLSSGVYVGSTAGMTANFNPSINKCTKYEEKGYDVVYSINLNQGDKLDLKLIDIPGGVDTSLYILSDCNDSANSCVAGMDDISNSLNPEVLEFTATEAGLYFIVLDTYSENKTYDYQLNLVLTAN